VPRLCQIDLRSGVIQSVDATKTSGNLAQMGNTQSNTVAVHDTRSTEVKK